MLAHPLLYVSKLESKAFLYALIKVFASSSLSFHQRTFHVAVAVPKRKKMYAKARRTLFKSISTLIYVSRFLVFIVIHSFI